MLRQGNKGAGKCVYSCEMDKPKDFDRRYGRVDEIPLFRLPVAYARVVGGGSASEPSPEVVAAVKLFARLYRPYRN